MVKVKPLPNAEALAFWRDKVQMSPGAFAKLSAAEKVHAFGISGIAKGGELETVFQALYGALENGDTYDEFVASAADVFERRGWTGRSAWRVDNIFRTNIQTAFSVGRYRQMMQVAALRPYWQYDAVNDSRTRPTHLAMDDKVFRHDHPFWDRWYPPNGYRCRCNVRTLSQREVDRDGLTVETTDPTGGLVEPKTPEGVTMPARPLMPDPGFAHNPGKAYWAGVSETDPSVSWTDAPNLKTAVDYHRPALSNPRIPITSAGTDDLLAPDASIDAVQAAFTARHGNEALVTDASGGAVVLTLDRVLDAAHRHLTPIIGDILESPAELWMVPQLDGTGGVRLLRRYIAVIESGGVRQVAVVEADKIAFLDVAALVDLDDAESIDAFRRGVLLWGAE